MSILHLLIWFTAYSIGIAALSVAAAGYLKSRTQEVRNRLFMLLAFSAMTVPAMLNDLFQATGLLWSMDQNSYYALTTSLTVITFWGAVFLGTCFLSAVLPDRYSRYGRLLLIIIAVPLTAAIVLYTWVPLPVIGLLSAWLTGIVLLFSPAAAFVSIIRGLAVRRSLDYTAAGVCTILFSLFYSDLVPVETNLILPGLYCGFSLVFLPYLVKKLIVRPAAEPDRATLQKLGISPREEDVVRLLLLGHSYKEIAEALFISLPTVQTHVTRIYQKAGVNSKIELLRLLSV